MTIEEQRKLVDSIAAKAERMFKSSKIMVNANILSQLSKEIAKLNKMEDAKREEI